MEVRKLRFSVYVSFHIVFLYEIRDTLVLSVSITSDLGSFFSFCFLFELKFMTRLEVDSGRPASFLFFSLINLFFSLFLLSTFPLKGFSYAMNSLSEFTHSSINIY